MNRVGAKKFVTQIFLKHFHEMLLIMTTIRNILNLYSKKSSPSRKYRHFREPKPKQCGLPGAQSRFSKTGRLRQRWLKWTDYATLENKTTDWKNAQWKYK